MKTMKIKFQNKEYWLIGVKSGPIATPYQYQHGLCSYAHLCENGEIMRFHKQIGTVDDIEFLGEVPKSETKLADDSWDNLLDPMNWMEEI